MRFEIDFANGDMSRWDFDMDYSGYVIAHFPEFEREHPRPSRRFADTIERTYSTCSWMTVHALLSQFGREKRGQNRFFCIIYPWNRKGGGYVEWINGMNAAVNYLEEHILEEPDLEKLGRLAGCSAHHFQRIFTYIGGITLSKYLRRRRMSLAAVDLKNESTRVIDIAQKYGYDSLTAFNQAFQTVQSSRNPCSYP